VAGTVRTAILQAVAERCPAGWRALVLSPPPHPRQMTWHLHLAASASLDLLDGRTVPTAPPPESQEWTLPSGRAAALSGGDPAPPPGPETRAVRVTGLYLSLTYRAEAPPAYVILLPNGSSKPHRFRSPADDVARLPALLDVALASAIGRRGALQSTAMGYSPSSWSAHQPAWIEIRGR
jgi:hypothetical protein